MKTTRRHWTEHEDAILRACYADTATEDVARRVKRSASSTYQRAYALGLRKSAAYFARGLGGRLTSRNCRRGGATRFPKGHVPANKGLRRPGWGPGRMKETQFKSGVRLGAAAKNWCPIGTIRTDTEGYQRIKVREARTGEAYGFGNVLVWPLLNRHVWEQAYGPIPAGHSVVFRDGNRQNCALDNLELVSRAELMRRNSVHNMPKELALTYQLIDALTRQIRKRDGHGCQE